MTSDIAFAIALTAGFLAIFVASIPTEHKCQWGSACPHYRHEHREEERP